MTDKETCLFLEGEDTVTPNGGQPINLSASELVTLPAGNNFL